MSILLKYWDKFWFSRFDPISASIFRICFGFALILYFVAIFPNWERFYSDSGILSINALGPVKFYMTNWSIFPLIEGKIPLIVLWWTGFFISIFFTIGFWTRLSAIILYVLVSSMCYRNVLILCGWDIVYRILLFYSCFASLNFCLSVDSWLQCGKISKQKSAIKKEFPLIWPIRLMQVTIALIYLITISAKLIYCKEWRNGDEIYWVLSSKTWSNFPYPDLFYMYNGVLSKIATYIVVFIEGSFPILVWFQRTKLFAIVSITLLHIIIAVMMIPVTFFSIVMIASFWVFVPPETTRKWFKLKNA